jgi:ABC-type glycerol-3-phosphate transport system substrate-binding protein
MSKPAKEGGMGMIGTSRRRKLVAGVLGAIVAALALAAAGCGGGGNESPAPATTAAPPAQTGGATTSGGGQTQTSSGLGSEYDLASAGDISLKLWWLGDLEVPGIEAWMKDMVTKFEAQYPNVKVETTTYDTNTWVQTQQTSCQSKSGPDIWYNWSGTWSLEPAWKGCTVPNEDVFAPADIEANPSTQETLWQGKTWVFPLYKFVYPVVVNLDLIKQAGLDPNSPPQTWDDFVAALQKIKAAGITPIALGLKDGFGAEIAAAGQLERQPISSPDDIKKLTIDGDITTDPGWNEWLGKLFQLKPYFNADANSLTFAEGLALWQNKKTAMVFGAPGVQSVIADAQKNGINVGLLTTPPFGSGAWANGLANTGNGFQVTQWSEHKEAAGAFLAWLQQPDNLQALYTATGTFPTSTNWDSSQVTSATDQEMLQWLSDNNSIWWTANYTPVDIDTNCRFVIFQKMMAGETDEAGAAKTCQDALTKWRKANPAALQNYQSWLSS